MGERLKLRRGRVLAEDVDPQDDLRASDEKRMVRLRDNDQSGSPTTHLKHQTPEQVAEGQPVGPTLVDETNAAL